MALPCVLLKIGESRNKWDVNVILKCSTTFLHLNLGVKILDGCDESHSPTHVLEEVSLTFRL
jgi:hypothetical protein